MLNSQAITDQISQHERKLYTEKLAHTYNPNKAKLAQKDQAQQNIENNLTENVQQNESPMDLQPQDAPHTDLQQSTLNSIVPVQDVEFYQPPKAVKARNKYGNMLIFCETKSFLLSLGPNYLFFFFAYLCFTLATIYLVGLANYALQNSTFKTFNFIFCWMQNLSYLLIALSNPGVKLPQDKNLMDQQQLKSKRFCHKCDAIQQRKTYHCRQCDVCIVDYDHHCPWTSKCIGGGNLNRFYFFVCMTPLYIFYYMVVFMICMANSAVKHNNNLQVHPKTF